MYLKRLELSGFKTFADHTTLEFGPGVTAIVGPNGSGKSNLADAIIWCLGEQSLKTVRSSRSHDVIFAGSEARRRAGVGEVSVTLDNSDGALPLDFSEVTITRRVFRTGEGEYSINRVPCRLRDIHELLLDTGVGKHAYSVISQNEIDRILSARPEDRREIIEQAAGIQRYRQRKHEATRRLDKVRENLLRVNDILHELEAQLAPLAQQCEAARDYRRLSKELFDLRLSLLVNEHQSLSESLARSREREAELERELEAARTRSHQLAAQEVELRAQLQELEGRLDETRGLVARLAREVERADGRVGLAAQRIEDLQRQAAATELELGQLQAQLAAAEAELAELERQEPELVARVARLRADAAAREERLRQETGSLRTAGDSIEQQRAEHLEALRQLADARNRQVQCESMLEAARARMARLQEQRQAAAARRQEVQAKLAEAARAAEEQRARRDAAQEELQSLQGEEAEAEGRLAELQARQLELRERLSGVSSRRRALQEMERSREGLRAGARTVLQAAEQGRLPRAYRTVAELLRVPRELEAAVEAALGPAAGDLVVPAQQDAAEAIAFLKQTRAGRATFLPLSDLRPAARPAELAELARRPGCVGIAAELVACERGAEEVVEHLLGRVLVMESLEAALALSRSAQGWRALVTVEGDLVRPWGAITGGSRPAGPQLIGRAREIEDLEREHRDLEQALSQVARDLEQASGRLAAVRASREARRGEIEGLLGEAAEAERLAEVLEDNARLEQQREEAVAAEQGALEEEIARTEEELETARLSVGEMEARKRALESAMSDFEAAVRAGRDAREELAEEAAELRVQLTAAEGELRTLAARRDKVREGQALLGTGLDDKRALQQRLAEARGETEAALREAQGEAERMRERLREGEQELAGQQTARQQLLDQIAARLEEAARNREETEGIQGRLHRCQLRTTQLDSELSFTERALLEEFRLSLEEAEQRAAPIESRTATRERVKELQGQVDALGEVNLGAIEEYDRVQERVEFLQGQRADLEAAREDLQQAILKIDQEATSRFLAAFEEVGREFRTFFVRLFGGGHADLTLSGGEIPLECGVDVTVTAPGKKTRDLLQLSGGERALTAAAILFALLKVRPSPFVILDEIDAPLDDSNVGRYCEVLREFAESSQFIVITHNKGTMEAADILYGVTMQEPGASTLIGIRLRDAIAQAEQEEARDRSDLPAAGAEDLAAQPSEEDVGLSP